MNAPGTWASHTYERERPGVSRAVVAYIAAAWVMVAVAAHFLTHMVAP